MILKSFDQGSGQAHAVIGTGNLLPLKPCRFFQFAIIELRRAVARHIAEKARQKGIRKRPGLTLPIADILHFQSDLFHDLPAERLFKALPDLAKARDQRVPGLSPRVFGQ